MFRFSIRSLLVLTALVAIGLALGLAHHARMQRLSRLHARQAVLVAEHRNFLLSCSFEVPQIEWIKIDDRERMHRQLAEEYRDKSWRPWVRITEPPMALPIQIESETQ
jgi:hypothetical protein